MKMSPKRRTAAKTKSKSTTKKKATKKATSAKPKLVGQVHAINASLTMIIADAKLAKTYDGVGPVDGDLDDSDWSRAIEAMGSKDVGTLELKKGEVLVLSLAMGGGIGHVFAIEDRLVLVEAWHDDMEDELFLEWVASPTRAKKTVGTVDVKSGKMGFVSCTDSGSEEMLAVKMPRGSYRFVVESSATRSWGQARRCLVTPA